MKLLFDAAHAFGCSYPGRKIGNFGEAEVFSFHATKFLNTFEGGAVVTNDDELADKIRLMTNFGFAGYDRVIYLGINGKMSEPAAAMGLTGLECLDEFVTTNRRHYKRYKDALTDVPGVQMIHYDEAEQNNYQYIVLEIDELKTHISRDLISSILHCRERACPSLLLSRLPSHGALPLVFSACWPAAAGNRKIDSTSAVLTHRDSHRGARC